MSNDKQTAIDTFKEKLIDIFEDYHDGIITLYEYIENINKATEKAKEMEKEQIVNAYHVNPRDAKWQNIGINYYNETYGGNK